MSVPLSSQSIFSFLVVLSLKATLVLTVASLASSVARRSSASLRHRIWALAIAGVLLLPMLQVLLPAWDTSTGAARSQIWRAALAMSALRAQPVRSRTAVDAVFEQPLHMDWTAWAVLIPLAGTGLMLIRLGRSMGRLRQTSSRAVPVSEERILQVAAQYSRALPADRPVRLLIAEEPGAMPCTWGYWHPRILLPASAVTWPADRLHMVLAHEFAHIAHSDWLLGIFAEAARAMFWFHPLVWLAASRLRDTSERACDDAVLNSGQDAARYAEALLDLLRLTDTYPAAALTVARPSNIERRFNAMLNPNINRRRLTRTAALSTTAAALLGVLSLAALRAPAQEAAAQFTGAVLDSRGNGIPNATVEMTNTQTHERRMTGTDTAGAYEFSALAPGDYDFRVQREGFQDYVSTQSLTAAAGSSGPVTMISGDPEPPSGMQKRIRVGGNVSSANLIRKVSPVYPASAKAAGMQGSVELRATIDKEGAPIALQVRNLSVDPGLARSAIEAVSQWRYQPTLLNGEPVEIETAITVHYTLAP